MEKNFTKQKVYNPSLQINGILKLKEAIRKLLYLILSNSSNLY